MKLADEPLLNGASERLDAALKIMFDRENFPGDVDAKIFDLRSRLYAQHRSWPKIREIAQEKSNALASELNMPFFGKITAAPTKEKKPKPGAKPKKTDKVKVPTGNLMNKEVDLEGMKMKITSNRLFLDGKPYKAVVDAGLAGNIDLNFNSAKFTSGGDRVFLSGKIVGFKAKAAAAVGIPASGEGEILTKDLVRYAKQLKTKREVTVTEFDPPLEIVRASMAEALYMSPDQLNMFVLNELKNIGFIKEPQEENMKITAGQLRQIIREELGRAEEELGDGELGSGEAELLNKLADEAIADAQEDDLEMESFEVMLFSDPLGKRGESKRVHVDVNIAGHKDSRKSKEAAKKVAEEEYPGWKAQFAEFEKVGGLDANL